MRRRGCRLMFVVAAFALAVSAWGATEEYEIGGPLAGLKLPLFRGQHGEEPGYPGCIPELMAGGAEVRDFGNIYREWGSQGQAPEVELYPGAEEHWRAYWFKYCPVRSFFDRQSQLKNFVAPDIPRHGGNLAAQVEQYAAPVYWVPRHAAVRNTGRRRAPVPVIRLKVNEPVFRLDLGELGPSMYAVRVIAAVPTEQLRPFRRPVFLRARINDGNQGEVTEYKKRIGYCDEFYSVCEFYFNAPERRRYLAEVWMDVGSEVDLLVHNISLDDVLAGATRQALKTRGNLASGTPPATRGRSKYTREERLARDAALWNYLPPLNHQGSGNTFRQASYTAIFPPEVEFGVGNKKRAEVNNEYGPWTPPPGLFDRGRFADNHEAWNLFLVHQKLGLKYTLDDMRNYRPLPDPYPLKDDGTGLYFPDPADPGKGRVWAEIAIEVMDRIRNYPTLAGAAARAWSERGDVDAAHDGAIVLARYAYLFPSIESATYLCNLVRDPGAYGRNMFDRRREAEAMFLTHYARYLDAPKWYDALFDYIQGNQELADSIGRFIPWVKTPEDVVKLLDVYLVQMTAKRVMRYHYHTEPVAIAELAGILGLSETTRPWMDWLFSRTFVYPLPPAGMQDLMITGCDREGAQYIGSTFYAQGEGALGTRAVLQRFKPLGILTEQYDITRSDLYPKPVAKCYWHLDIIMGGRDFCRIGDVGGPDKPPGATLDGVKEASVHGWAWTRDPRFAWVIKNQVGRKGYTDAEWAEIEAAAAKVPRAPWLENRSRQVYNWFAALEAGVPASDFAARRGAYLRIGAGIGHEHSDSLDLQFYAHGLPMTIDGGQRPGYSTPSDRSGLVHNLVVVSGRATRGQSWARCISDVEGARYLSADGAPTATCPLYRRGIALIDVDTQPVNSYIFDVFRVAGGSNHDHCFHGPIADEVTTNAPMQPVPAPKEGEEGSADAKYLAVFDRSKDSWLAGGAPEVLETTWRYSREPGPGSERNMLGAHFRADAPRKYTRLMLFDVAGARVLRADAVCYQWNYRYNCQMVRRVAPEGQSLASVFPAIYEPYAGEPFIIARRLVPIPGNEAGARRAVALEVRTRNGQTDLCFSDGRPERVRQFGAQAAEYKIAAEFAYHSTDVDGLRQAALTGGTLLAAPGVELRMTRSEYTGKVTAVDYLRRTMRIDEAWPAVCVGQVFEIGTPERMTSYTLEAVQPEGQGTVLKVTRGADYLRSPVLKVEPDTGKVTCQLQPSLGPMPGLDRNFVASNDACTKFWRADVLPERQLVLRGAPVAMDDFAPAGAIRLWEYGTGDSVRLSTFASLRRVGAGVYELHTNADVTIALAADFITVGHALEGPWREVLAERRGTLRQVQVSTAELSPEGRLFLRVAPR